MRVLIVLAGLIALASASTNWAVLVAGSNTYGNYRHQSDIYHMYQILKTGNFDDDHIVVMHFDDIANNKQNPFPGNVINHIDGDDVYHDVPKDYTGADVTAKNFLAVITGDQAAVGDKKVINPTSEDNVFIYYSDHGSVGLVAMPSGGYLYAKDLNAALQQMADNKQFHRLVFYLEACESGSMFEDILPDNIQIYTTTASNAKESSYACYYDSSRNAYLGDLYSVNFMEDMDANDTTKENLQENFEITKRLTDLSHVMQYGDMSYTDEVLSHYVNFGDFAKLRRRQHLGWRQPITDAVDSRDVPLMTLKMNLAHANGPEREDLLRQIADEEAHRVISDRRFDQLRRVVDFAGYNVAPINSLGGDFDHDCHKTLVEGVEARCGRFSDYSLKYVRHLAEYCAAHVPTNEVLSAMEYICDDQN